MELSDAKYHTVLETENHKLNCLLGEAALKQLAEKGVGSTLVPE